MSKIYFNSIPSNFPDTNIDTWGKWGFFFLKLCKKTNKVLDENDIIDIFQNMDFERMHFPNWSKWFSIQYNVSLFAIMMHHWWWKDVSVISYPPQKVQFTSWIRCGAASWIISVSITRFPKSYKKASAAYNKINNPTRNQERYKTKQRHPTRFTSVDFSSWDQWKKRLS